MKAQFIPSYDVLRKWLRSEDPVVVLAAEQILGGYRHEMPAAVAEHWLDAGDAGIRLAALSALRDRQVPADLLARGLKDPDSGVRNMALLLCDGQRWPFAVLEYWAGDGIRLTAGTAEGRIRMVERALMSADTGLRHAAANVCRNLAIPDKTIRDWLRDSDFMFRAAAMYACRNHKVPYDLVRLGLEDPDPEVRAAAMVACERKSVPLEAVRAGLTDIDGDVREAAITACGCRTLPIRTIERWVRELAAPEDEKARFAVLDACRRRRIPEAVIRSWWTSGEPALARAAVNACVGQEAPLDVIWEALCDASLYVQSVALQACEGKKISPEQARLWMVCDEEIARQGAVRMCRDNRAIPPGLVLDALEDGDACVRRAAMEVCHANRIDVPLRRTCEPPEKVYKKCLGGVVVVARIPADAQVRGDSGGKCRADKAVITDVIGTLYGEPVGVSAYDKRMLYYKGQEVLIRNFDYMDEECSSGFHFFHTLDEARAYD